MEPKLGCGTKSFGRESLRCWGKLLNRNVFKGKGLREDDDTCTRAQKTTTI